MAWLFSKALMNRYENSHSLPVRAGESLGANCSDGEPSVPSKSTPMPQACLWHGKTTAAWKRFPSGMTCEPLTDDLGGAVLTWFLAGFPVRILVQQERGSELMVNEVDYGKNLSESLAKYDPVSHSWKTHQFSLAGDLELFSETYSNWGMMRNGQLLEVKTPKWILTEREYGLLPRPCAGDYRRGTVQNYQKLKAYLLRHQLSLQDVLNMIGLENGEHGQTDPIYTEIAMDWPIGWTALRPLETAKFQQWLDLHGRH